MFLSWHSTPRIMGWVVWKAFIHIYCTNHLCFDQDLGSVLRNLIKYLSTRRKEKPEALNTMDDDVFWKALIQSLFTNHHCFKQDLTGLLKNLFKYSLTRRKQNPEALNTMDDDVSILKSVNQSFFLLIIIVLSRIWRVFLRTYSSTR